MKSKQLILITSSFPYGNGEPFLETELTYLCKDFEKVLIFSRGCLDQNLSEVPQNVIVISIANTISFSQRLVSLLNVFNRTFLNELKIIHTSYSKKFTIGILKTMLVSLQKAKVYRNAILNELNQMNPNETIIYSYWSDDAAIALALLKKKNRRLKVISRVHGWDLYFNVSQYDYLPFRGLICEQMDAIYSISTKGKNEIKNTWKQGVSNVSISRLGVASQEKGELPISFNLVSCSNLISLKRVHLIIEALSQITSFEIEWTHFGEGPLFNLLKDQSQKLPSNIKVEWRGHVENAVVLDYYRDNDVSCFINVSSSEGVPVSIMEAFSFGIPAIATDVGGMREIVDDENGFLLTSNPTAQEVAAVIQNSHQLSNDEKVMKRKSAYSTWERKYSAENNYGKFIEKIKQL